MSLTTFGDLLTEAEDVLTELAARRSLDAAGMVAGWQPFARRAVHAVTAATGERDPRWYAVDRLAIQVARPMPVGLRAKAAAAVDPQPALARAGHLLGAAGDLLAAAPRGSVADVMADDATVRAAQARVAGLLAAGAHLVVRAVDEAEQAGQPLGGWTLLVGIDASIVEQLAAAVMASSPATTGRADDVAAVTLGSQPVSLEEVVEVWGRQARETVRAEHPSARDLQGLSGDLARLAAHSRVIVRAAVHEQLLDPDRALAVDTVLGEATGGWLTVSAAWSPLHTPSPATPEKIAASHALGRALIAVTREGKQWATPEVVAARVDVIRAMAVIRRGQDVAYDVALTLDELLPGLTQRARLFVPKRLLAPGIANLTTRQQPGLAPAGTDEVRTLTSAVRSTRLSAGEARATLHRACSSSPRQ
ncbi:MAG: hypothetical protein ACOYBY_05725 [Dermatophilaceae bacterium]